MGIMQVKPVGTANARNAQSVGAPAKMRGAADSYVSGWGSSMHVNFDSIDNPGVRRFGSAQSDIYRQLPYVDKTILVVHTGLDHKRFIFRKLKELGLTVVVAHKEKTEIDPYVDHWILTDLTDHETTLGDIDSFLEGNRNVQIDGALTFWEESTITTAKIAEQLNVIGIPADIAEKTRNKYLFRQFCSANQIKSPEPVILNGGEDIARVEDKIKGLAFPVVVKPTYGSASTLVIKVEKQDKLESVIRYVEQKIPKQPDAAEWPDRSIVVEEYIDGDEVDIDIVLQSGKIQFYSITDNHQTDEPYFREKSQEIPSRLPQSDQEALIALAEDVLKKLGVSDGVIHFEAKMSPSGPVPIEVNLRMGGDEVYSFVKTAWGVDLVEQAVIAALGERVEIEKPSSPLMYLSGAYFLAEHSGVLSELSIDPSVRQMEHVVEFHFEKGVGDECLAPPDGFEYLGWVAVKGKTRAEAKKMLDLVKSKVAHKISRFLK